MLLPLLRDPLARTVRGATRFSQRSINLNLSITRNNVVLLVFGSCLFFISACSLRQAPAASSASRNGTQLLRKHAEQLWAARLARDCRAQYAFEDPAQTPPMDETTFVSWCKNEDPFRVSEYAIHDVEVREDWGWVRVVAKTVYTSIPDAEVEGAETWEKWHKVHGRWYSVPKRDYKTVPEAPSLRNAVEEERLRVSFEQSWAALKSEDWHRLYELLDPLDRNVITEEKFVAGAGSIRYLDNKVHWVEVIGERGRIHVSYEHRLTDTSLTKLPSQEVAVTDYWIARDGEWFRDLKRP